MSEHEHADPAAPEGAPRRRGTFLPAAEPIAPKSIDEAEGLLMPIYAEPVVHTGATRAAGTLPAAAELTVDVDDERTAATRLRRGAQIATAGMAAAVIAVVAGALAPTPPSASTTAHDSSAHAGAQTSTPSKEAQPQAAEGGRVRVDLHKAEQDDAQPGDRLSIFGIPVPPPSVAPAEGAQSGGSGGSGASGTESAPGTQAPTTGGSQPTSAPTSGTSAPTGGATAPATTAPVTTAPRPSPTGTTPTTAPAAPPTSTTSPTTTPPGTTAPAAPPTSSSPPPTSPTRPPSETTAPPPETKAPLSHTLVQTSRGVLGLVAPSYRVDLVGEPDASVRVSTGLLGIATQTVTLDGSGAASVSFRGLLSLTQPRVSATYA